MYFKESLPPDYKKTLTTFEYSIPEGMPRLKPEREIVINLMPAHPYQYPFHHQILSLLSKKEDVLESLVTRNAIRKVILLISTSMKPFYFSIANGNVTPVFQTPVYPFLSMKVLSALGSKDVHILDWFEFMCLLVKFLSETIEGLPLSVTNFTTGEKFVSFVPPKARIGSVLRSLNISGGDDYLFTNHPFNGDILSNESVIPEFRPFELLIFPKKSTKRETFLKKLGRIVLHRSSMYFLGLYSTIPLVFDNPCQKCLRCVTLCPVDLHPFILSAFAKKGNTSEAVNFSITRCIECGLCSYICPSGIPLMHNIMTLKKELT